MLTIGIVLGNLNELALLAAGEDLTLGQNSAAGCVGGRVLRTPDRDGRLAHPVTAATLPILYEKSFYLVLMLHLNLH